MSDTQTPSNTTERQGHCLCGAVKITARHASDNVGVCHCGMCRRWTGGPFLALSCGTDVIIEGEENITLYDSSPWAERGFCAKCGTNLFYRLKETGDLEVVAGLFDDTKNMVLDSQIFIDEKPGFYSFAEKTKNMTGAEVMEMFAPSNTKTEQ